MSKYKGDLEAIEIRLNSKYNPPSPLPDDLRVLSNEFEQLLEDSAQARKHVYAVAGMALCGAQCFETALHELLLSVKAASGALTSKAAFAELDVDLSGKTLGNLLYEAKRIIAIDENGVDLLGKAWAARNTLVHGYFWLHAEDFQTVEGCRRMVADLLQRIQLYKTAERFIGGAVELLHSSYGISEEDVRRSYQRMLVDLESKSKETLWDRLDETATK